MSGILAGQERIEGWKAIAAEVGVSETRARELADPRRMWPLPVRYGARGFYIVREVLAVWFHHFDAPFGAHATLKKPTRTRTVAEELQAGKFRAKHTKRAER